MALCKFCEQEVLDSDVICGICHYPLQGTSQEQASFIARQVIDKSDVEDAIEKLKKARYVLFGLSAFYIIFPFTPMVVNSSVFTTIVSLTLGAVFICFGLLTYKYPKIALLIPLGLTLIYYLVLLLINPLLLWSGILWKMIVLVGLGYGYFSARKSDKILKNNPYLASSLGFKAVRN